MPDVIFEDSNYKIVANIKSGVFKTKYKGKLDLHYMYGDTEVKTETDIDVNNGKVEKNYLVPKVKDTDANYVLKIIANYGKNKEKTLILAEATVWPREAKWVLKDTEDKPVAGVRITITFGDNRQIFTDTNKDGVAVSNLSKTTYTYTVKAPWEIVTDKNDVKKREHQIVVRRNMQAKILKPDLTQKCYVPATEGGEKTAGVRQYVNAPLTDKNGCDADGSTIEFEVACKKLSDGLTNDKIYIKVEFSKISARTTPAPALLAPAEDIQTDNGGKEFTGFVKLPSDGGTAKFKLQLGYAGGETFKVSVGYSKGDPSDDTQTFVTWRKITYQLRYPTIMKSRMTARTRKDGTKYFDLPDSVMNVVKPRLAAVFVEYENKKSIEFNLATDAPARVTRGFLENTDSKEVCYVIDEDLEWLGGAPDFDVVADQRETQITFCDAALDEDVKTLNPTLTLSAVSSEEILDADEDYKYFVYKPFTTNSTNLVLAGYKWKADLSTVAIDDKLKKPTLNVVYAAKDFDDWNDFEVEAKSLGSGKKTVSFDQDNTLTQSAKTILKNYFDECMANDKKLREAKLHTDFTVTGGSGEDDMARKKAISDEIKRLHTASNKKVLYHPGIDADGNPREGEMSELTIEQTTCRKMKFEFPVTDEGTTPMIADIKPGDFVGAASASKCPINVEFSITGAYTYNGHAGGGKQVLVLRKAIGAAIAATVCHELGHAMGMAIMPTATGDAMPVPPGLPVIKHVDTAGGTYYRNKSSAPYNNGFRDRHQGPHCCDGIPANKKAHRKFNGWSADAAHTVCIMWGEGGEDDSRTAYCAVCTKYLLARDLRDIRKTWAGSAAG